MYYLSARIVPMRMSVSCFWPCCNIQFVWQIKDVFFSLITFGMGFGSLVQFFLGCVFLQFSDYFLIGWKGCDWSHLQHLIEVLTQNQSLKVLPTTYCTANPFKFSVCFIVTVSLWHVEFYLKLGISWIYKLHCAFFGIISLYWKHTQNTIFLWCESDWEIRLDVSCVDKNARYLPSFIAWINKPCQF